RCRLTPTRSSSDSRQYPRTSLLEFPSMRPGYSERLVRRSSSAGRFLAFPSSERACSTASSKRPPLRRSRSSRRRPLLLEPRSNQRRQQEQNGDRDLEDGKMIFQVFFEAVPDLLHIASERQRSGEQQRSDGN